MTSPVLKTTIVVGLLIGGAALAVASTVPFGGKSLRPGHLSGFTVNPNGPLGGPLGTPYGEFDHLYDQNWNNAAGERSGR
jgi:hypothetical protein